MTVPPQASTICTTIARPNTSGYGTSYSVYTGRPYGPPPARPRSDTPAGAAAARAPHQPGRLGGVASKHSAGILLFRGNPGTDDDTAPTPTDGTLEVLLGHMGGPFWARRDAGAWSVVKGEYEPDEPALSAARREFREELGLPVPDGELVPLGDVRQSGGKVVTVWALLGDLDPALAVPGTFTMEWPNGSGRLQEFPEIDRAAWLPLDEARKKIVKGQRPFLDRLTEHLADHRAAD